MSLETDIKGARGGFLPNTPQHHYESASGFAPYLWYGDDAVAATAPWTNAPVGSTYIYKASESAAPVMYQKMAAAGAVFDWIMVNAWRVQKIPITTLTNAEIDTGWDLPTNAIVYDVFVDVTTLEGTATTKTIDVGLLSSETGGDADGFLDGISTATPAMIRGGVFTFTDGSNQNYVSANTMGLLLWDGLNGGDVAGTAGTVVRTPHIAKSLTAKSISYTLGSAHTELVANIYIVYVVLP